MEKQDILQVSPSVKWIGVIDYDIVTFDVVMTTEYGSTYNSYFIDAEKKTIIDTAKETFWQEYERKIKAVVNPREIEYIVMNHTEPDHSGNLQRLLELAPKAKVVASAAAIKYLNDMNLKNFDYIIVKDGDTLDLGNKTLRFISAPSLHWPDTIYSYLEEENILFTCDSFGCHFADPRMFDDLVDDFDVAFRYYFDVIIKPFSKFMLKAIDKIDKLKIDTICTGHGPILRKNWKHYVEMTRLWSQKFVLQPQKTKVFIPYVSAYHRTGIIAEAIGRGLQKAGNIEVDIMDIEQQPLGKIDMKLTQCNAIIVGSPVINQNILLPVYKLFGLINPYRDKGKLAGAFGSYGWSGENRVMIEANLRSLKLKYFGEGVFFKFAPDEEAMQKAEAFGEAFGKALLEKQ